MGTLLDINHCFNKSLNNPDIKITSMEWSILKLVRKQNIIITMTLYILTLKIKYKTFSPLMMSLLIIDILTCHLLGNLLQNILDTVLSEISSDKNHLKKDKVYTFFLMDSPIKVSGKITKCMAMENFSILETSSDTKVNFKMECLMDLEHNMHLNKSLKDKLKLIKLS